MDERVKGALETLEKHELALGYLYREFARIFEMDAELWRNLEEQERSHAFLIRNFRESDAEGLNLADRDFKIGRVKSSMEKASNYLKAARVGALDRKEALLTCVEIEKAMIDELLFEAIAGDSPAFTRMLKVLDEETHNHYDIIKQTLATIA